MAKNIFTVSKDGKTVTVNGKTYSVSAFKNQFKPSFWSEYNKDDLRPGTRGDVTNSRPASQRLIQVSAKTADEAKAKADKKATKKAASSLKSAKKPVKGQNAATARQAAKKRASMTAPSGRSSGQKYTLRGGGVGGAFLENLK